MTAKSDAEWLDEAAVYIAQHTRAEAVSTTHLWLALLADVKSRWAILIDDYGGGTYEDWRKDWEKTSKKRRRPELPAVWTLPDRELPPPRAGLSGFRRLLLGIRNLLINVLERVVSRQPSEEVGPFPWTEQARRIWSDTRLQRGTATTAGDYLVVLASLPGPHQYMIWRHGPAMAAAARREMGRPSGGDGLQLAMAWPARQGRRIKKRAEAKGKRPGASLLARAVPIGLSLLGRGFAVLRGLILGTSTFLLYALLAPAVLLLNGIRASISLLTGTSWRYRSGLTYPGGEIEVLWTDSRLSRGSIRLLLLPRALLFILGVLGLAPALARLRDVGQPVISAVAERPDLLKSLDAPFNLLGDLLGTNGTIRGFAIVAAVGALFLSIPTHREIEQARLVYRDLSGNAQSQRTGVLGGIAVLTKLGDGADDLIGWRVSPIYVTVHLLPILAGFVLAELLSRLIA